MTQASVSSTVFRSPRRRLTAVLLGLLLVVAAGWAGHRWTWQRGLERLSEASGHRLEMAAAALDAQLARFDYLPSLLETTPSVLDLLSASAGTRQRDDVNRLLRALNATAGAEMLYVLDRNGLTVAAADWDQQGTPYGMNLSFRPYVQEALARGRGRFYGVGVTSGRAGYYLSYALKRGGQTLGLATAKVSLAANERAWSQLPGQLMLLDERGVVILSSEARWRYRPLAPLDAAQRDEIARSRPYGASTLQPLAWQLLDSSGTSGPMTARLEGRRYLVNERILHEGRWRLRALDDLAALTAQAWQAALTAGLLVLVAALLAGLWSMRRRTLRQRLRDAEALRAAHDELESKVVLRTAELRRTNDRLAAEVEARRHTEAELRAAQQELVHNGKMAALGQMSAGMMHELNQPLAAMRTLSDNACVLLDQGREPEVRRNLQRLTHLVDRLAKLTAQLKLFAWKPGRSPLGTVRLAQAVAQAQAVVAPRQREHGVVIVVEIEPATLAVRADQGRLEQVLINLMGNGIEAMAQGPAGAQLRISAAVHEGMAHIVVQDQGPGIAADILPRLFEPFTTSKAAGSGLGLGLMISAHFAREFGGSLHGENGPAGGARFVLRLPQAGPASAASPTEPAASAAP